MGHLAKTGLEDSLRTVAEARLTILIPAAGAGLHAPCPLLRFEQHRSQHKLQKCNRRAQARLLLDRDKNWLRAAATARIDWARDSVFAKDFFEDLEEAALLFII